MATFRIESIAMNRLTGQGRELLMELAGMAYIAGGYARKVVDPDHSPEASDIDLFLYTDENFGYDPIETDVFEIHAEVDNILQELGYIRTRDLPNAIEYKKQGLVKITKDEYDQFYTDNKERVTLTKMYHANEHYTFYRYEDLAGYLPVQVIKPFENRGLVNGESKRLMKTYGQPEELLNLFDFDVAMVALEGIRFPVTIPGPAGEGAIYCKGISKGMIQATVAESFLESNRKKQLHIGHINCPIAVSMRVHKFLSKGYFISTREFIKLFKDWDARPSAYKSRLIELCEKEELDSRQWIEMEKLLRID